VGGSIPEFAAVDGRGGRFHSRELAGKRYLLKFYRGHWCPYCRRELRAWHAIGSQLAARGIRFVAVSPDTPEEVEKFARSHPHDSMRLLSDEDLRVTELFHLRSHATLAEGLGRSVRRPLAIPTTILVDAGGVVRWIDQSDDHQVRSDPKRVLPAIDRALGWTEVRASTAAVSFDPTTREPCVDCG
jgi:peroxiredoxin